jgi:hypothetical protein
MRPEGFLREAGGEPGGTGGPSRTAVRDPRGWMLKAADRLARVIVACGFV